MPFDIYFFTLKLKNSYKMAFFLKLFRGDFFKFDLEREIFISE